MLEHVDIESFGSGSKQNNNSFDKSNLLLDGNLLSSHGTIPSQNMPIRKLFSGASFGGEGDTKLEQYLARSIEENKIQLKKDFATEEKEEPFSLTLSPDSYANITDNQTRSKTKIKFGSKSKGSRKDQSKRVSQGSLSSAQNNRYNRAFDPEKSGASGSFADKLFLENSNLISNDDYQSPSNLLKNKSYTKYLTRSDRKSDASNHEELINENDQLINSIKKSQDSILKSAEKQEIISKTRHVPSRYDSFKHRDSDSNEFNQYNQTFSTFGPENETSFDAKPKEVDEDRIRPARPAGSLNPKNVYHRLYDPSRKTNVSELNS